MSEKMLSDRMFDGRAAEEAIGDGLVEAGLQDWSSLGCDEYDCSIEVHGIPPEFPMPEAAAKFLLETCGFLKVYANQTDGWEVHWSRGSAKGWRRRWVKDQSSGHNRVLAGAPDFGFWEVSEFPASWPQLWLDNGYVRVSS